MAIIIKNLGESSDVESNPGPGQASNAKGKKSGGSIEVISYNVRGLNDQKKLRHLVNYCYKKGPSKNKDQIFCFQETFIEKPGILPVLWRGNLHLTPGRGNSSGCLTLLSHHINIIHSKDFNDRAHVLVCQKSDDQGASFIIANIYAPNANSNQKIAFFEEILNEIAELQASYDCENTLVMGDFNLIFQSSECKNRAFSSQEKNVARAVKPILDDLNLSDIALKTFTWRRPNSEIFSAIDRMFFSRNMQLIKAEVNWSLSMSDHAAIESYFELPNKVKTKGTRISRLDPSLLKVDELKARVKTELRAMLDQAPPDWNPHLKLEYLKMCIRTIMEKAQAERKSNELNDEELLNVELDLAIKALSREDTRNKAELILHVEDLRAQKDVLIEKKGQRLADKLGTKWYQEGEKSTRYFLRILSRSTPDNFKELSMNDGTLTNDPRRIESEIVNYYKKLYENYEKIDVQETSDEDFFKEIISIDNTKQSEISAPVTSEEIVQTLRTCRDSAPGPDGIPYSVWRELWEEAGPILQNSWNYSLQTGKLPPSHKLSFLKLIPKLGKDQKLLTNWRPITLSDCDHKIFTKIYANRISERIAQSIGENQTAYLKGRLINDNVRSLLANIRIVNLEEDLNSVIISLDAKKAFDSIEHSFIEKCLLRFGLHSFIPIFRMLYSELRSDIIINGVIVPGYAIKRGVKQGDALSCILFIMCMEPLIRNLEKNQAIEPIFSRKLGSSLPKSYAYADDVNCVTKNKLSCIQAIFKEYERLTKLSGLTLNADKTEVLKVRSTNAPLLNEPPFRINYLGDWHLLKESQEIKVNGILLRQDEEAMRKSNVDAVAKKIDNILKKWSRRSLSVLGKILILKTFGVSQIIYLLQSMCLKPVDFKMLNSLLYKFIWNRNYLAAKAPERIKREIMNKPIKLGGLGMLDVAELDNSLKLKALGRLERSKHPMLLILRSKLDLSNFFFPTCTVELEDVISRGIELLARDRQALWEEQRLYSNRIFVKSIKDLKLSDIVSRNGKNSIAYFNIRRNRKTKIAELNALEIGSLSPFVNTRLIEASIETLNLNPGTPEIPSSYLYYNGSSLAPINKLTSKQIRDLRSEKEPICIFKFGHIMAPDEALNWAHNVSRLTSTKHKDLLLRLAHGELYYRERLHRYNLIDSPLCLRCNQLETLEHKFVTCSYVTALWKYLGKLISPLDPNPQGAPSKDKVLCIENPRTAYLTIHAEIIARIRLLKPNSEYSVHPRVIVTKAIEYLIKRENKIDIRSELKDLLDER